jgi:3-dehydroquinate synthase
MTSVEASATIPSGDDEARTEVVRVDLAARPYDIHVGAGVLDRAGELLRPLLAQPRVVIVSDRHVAERHLGRLTAALDRASILHHEIVVPPGEGAKSAEQLVNLIDRLLELRIERRTTLVAFGGGVVGDLAGFAASIVLRGVDFAQVPTTLLSQVDSSVGGKTGINTRHGKNLIGSFHQPRLVVADTDVVKTLPRRELLAGYAEVVKYGVLGDSNFFAWLETHGRAVVGGDPAALRQAVAHSCRMKASIVARDEREDGERALLNLGHTFGHALEAELGYGDELLHGEAVAIGMTMACDLSVRLGLCPPTHAVRVRAHLKSVGLPTSPKHVGRRWDPARLLDHMSRDKKVRDGRLTFVLVRGIGQAHVSRDVDPLLSEAVAA